MGGDDLKRFSAAVLALNECARLADFGPALLAAMQTLLDVDSVAVNWAGRKRFEDISVRSAKLPGNLSLEFFNTHFHQHPLWKMVEQTWDLPEPQAGKWSDFTTHRQFRQTALYHDFFRHTGTRHQLAATVRIGSRAILGVSFNRERLDFRSEEIKLAELFAGHVRQGVAAVLQRAEIERMLALHRWSVGDDAVMLVGPGGTICLATEKARHLVQAYFPGATEANLPPTLQYWLMRHPARGKWMQENARGRLVCLASTSVTWPLSGRGILLPLLEKVPPSDLRCLRFAEEKESDSIAALQNLGLTAREAEVLHWMAQGKRNEEIATILGASPRTIDKHCEHLFAKLNVETRTAAVAMAREVM